MFKSLNRSKVVLGLSVSARAESGNKLPKEKLNTLLWVERQRSYAESLGGCFEQVVYWRCRPYKLPKKDKKRSWYKKDSLVRNVKTFVD